MKKFLTQWEIRGKNRKIDGGVLLMGEELANLKNDAEYGSLPKAHKISEKIFQTYLGQRIKNFIAKYLIFLLVL